MRKGERMEGIVSSSLIRPNEITISYDAPFALSFVFFSDSIWHSVAELQKGSK